MKIVAGGSQPHHFARVAARCPHCGREAVLEHLGEHDYMVSKGILCGQRRCPNAACHGHIFVVIQNNEVVAAYPPIRLDFDPEHLPQPVLGTFEEAISCHSSGCYVAAAIMVRRTLEEVCEDRKATGKDLKARIADLKGKIVIPQELFEAMDELRVLGNDAAHIEAKSYDSISADEVVIAIQFTKEILKAVYQYAALLSKMRSLKKGAQ